MKILIKELETALSSELYYSALISALIIPDICSALESESGQTSGAKYKAWFDKYLSNRYDGFVTGEDIYKVRCALLHQGKLNHDNPNYQRILFQPPGKGPILHKNIIEGALNLNLEIFVNDIIAGYYQWEESCGDKEHVKVNSEHSINLYPNGFPPYITGSPLIC